jgi:hypothetical protein
MDNKPVTNGYQKILFEDDKKTVHKRRVNQKNLADIYTDEIDTNDLLPEKYRQSTDKQR